MVRKPGSMYREIRGQAYTRREYMGGVPANRINEYEIGDRKRDYYYTLHLLPLEQCQIRHIALESARIVANRHISKNAGTAYFLKIRVYPHNVLRENKVAVGAGADRISDGMRRAFGKAVGTAARVRRNQQIITLKVLKEHLAAGKEALRKASTKLAIPCRVVVEETHA